MRGRSAARWTPAGPRPALVLWLAATLLAVTLVGDLHLHPEPEGHHAYPSLTYGRPTPIFGELELASTCEPGGPLHAEQASLHRLKPCTVCLHRLESRVAQPRHSAILGSASCSWFASVAEIPRPDLRPGRSGPSRAPPSC